MQRANALHVQRNLRTGQRAVEQTIGIRKLSMKGVEHLRESGRVSDGGELFPQVGQHGKRRIFRVQLNKRQWEFELGSAWTSSGNPPAARVRQRIRTVLNWARAAGHRSGDNPVDLLDDQRALPKHKMADAEHHWALPSSAVGRFKTDLRAGPSLRRRSTGEISDQHSAGMAGVSIASLDTSLSLPPS